MGTAAGHRVISIQHKVTKHKTAFILGENDLEVSFCEIYHQSMSKVKVTCQV